MPTMKDIETPVGKNKTRSGSTKAIPLLAGFLGGNDTWLMHKEQT
jgi:hypothetical protein